MRKHPTPVAKSTLSKLKKNFIKYFVILSSSKNTMTKSSNQDIALEHEVQQRDAAILDLSEQLDEMDTERRRSTLIFTGRGVPAVSGDRQYAEDVSNTVLDMVRSTFPSVSVGRSDIANCYRVGSKRTRVVQFLRHGRGTPRDQLYQARFDLMKERDGSKTIFVNESLSSRKRHQLNTLRMAKKNGQIHSVFTRDCVVYFREKKDGAIQRVQGQGDELLRRFGGDDM